MVLKSGFREFFPNMDVTTLHVLTKSLWIIVDWRLSSSFGVIFRRFSRRQYRLSWKYRWHQIRKSNMTMENQPFEDVYPVKLVIFHCHVSFWGMGNQSKVQYLMQELRIRFTMTCQDFFVERPRCKKHLRCDLRSKITLQYVLDTSTANGRLNLQHTNLVKHPKLMSGFGCPEIAHFPTIDPEKCPWSNQIWPFRENRVIEIHETLYSGHLPFGKSWCLWQLIPSKWLLSVSNHQVGDTSN